MNRRGASDDSLKRYLVCLEVEGMTCQLCAERVKRVIMEEGFCDVEVDLYEGFARFQYSGEPRDLSGLLSKIEASGLPKHRYVAKLREHRLIKP